MGTAMAEKMPGCQLKVWWSSNRNLSRRLSDLKLAIITKGKITKFHVNKFFPKTNTHLLKK